MSDGLKYGRRDFSKIAAAAFGGIAAGAGVAQAQESGSGSENQKDRDKLTMDPMLLSKEPHVCRGLNTCKGQGQSKDNACGGQGACAAIEHHTCNGKNECKGQGGCGGYPGQNTCQGKGHCAVPLKKEVWTTARKQFEEVMKDLGKEIGKAP